jgi:hypothetical protein
MGNGSELLSCINRGREMEGMKPLRTRRRRELREGGVGEWLKWTRGALMAAKTLAEAQDRVI